MAPYHWHQWISKYIPGAMNTQTTIEMMDTAFSVVCHIKGKLAISYFQNLIIH
jgi:hypothetical protein